jgi:hypothetical protein
MKSISVALAAAGFLAAGCTGAINGSADRGRGGDQPGDTGGTGPGKTGPGMQPPPINPTEKTNLAGQRPLRRLTLFEYRNTIRDLLAVSTLPGRAGFSVDIASTGGFVSGAKITSSVDAKQFVDSSEQLATAAVARLADLMPRGCATPAPAAEEDCARQFIKQFGLRAYRRPPTAHEESELLAFYKQLRGPEITATFPEAIKELIAGIIQSPQFLYRWELGEAPIKDGPLYRLNNWEIASALSYFLWASMPDAALFTAAQNGELQLPDRIAQQARRMLMDAKARDGVRDFHLQWLDAEGLPDMQKDPAFTSYSPEVAQAMLNETGELAASILLGPQATGKLSDLFSTSSSFLDARLARHYGAMNVTGDNLRPVALDPGQRAGLLTQGSFLAAHADADVSHPVKRGVHILRQVLCLDLPDPNGLDIPVLPEPKPGQTTRERYAAHAQGFCASCHSKIDGVGFAFENYDATGKFRTMEQNKPVDSSGTVPLPSGDITFGKGIDFIRALATTRELRECVARQWVRYVLRRTEVPEEAGTAQALATAFANSSYDVRELLVALTTTRAFTHRKPGLDEGL